MGGYNKDITSARWWTNDSETDRTHSFLSLYNGKHGLKERRGLPFCNDTGRGLDDPWIERF